MRHAVWTEASELAPEPGPDGIQQWTVDFDVTRAGWVLGTDQGVVWFDHQNMYVVGRRTSFVIPGHRITANPEKGVVIIRPFQRKFSLKIKSEAGFDLGFQCDVLTVAPFVPETLPFLTAVRECKGRSDPDLEGQLPPETPSELAHTQKFLLANLSRHLAVAGLLVLLSLALVGYLYDRIRFTPVICLVIVGALIYQIGVWASPKIGLATRSLRELRRYSQSANR